MADLFRAAAPCSPPGPARRRAVLSGVGCGRAAL